MYYVLVALVLLVGGCGSPEQPPRPPVLGSDSAAAASAPAVELATAQHAVAEYFAALAGGRAAEARELLAAGPRSDASVAALEAAGRGMRGVELVRLEPVQAAPERIVFEAVFEGTPQAGPGGEWRAGTNRRWVEVVHTRRGWRIARVADAMIAPAPWWPVTEWAQVHILEAGLALEVPGAWRSRPDEWAWSPYAAGLPRVGVRWAEAGAGAAATDLLPRDAELLHSEPVSVPWGKGTLYRFADAPAGPPTNATHGYTQHIVVRTDDGRLYDFYGAARSEPELRAVHWVLHRMLGSVHLMPGALLREEPRQP